jgi:hypothetical protein
MHNDTPLNVNQQKHRKKTSIGSSITGILGMHRPRAWHTLLTSRIVLLIRQQTNKTSWLAAWCSSLTRLRQLETTWKGTRMQIFKLMWTTFPALMTEVGSELQESHFGVLPRKKKRKKREKVRVEFWSGLKRASKRRSSSLPTVRKSSSSSLPSFPSSSISTSSSPSPTKPPSPLPSLQNHQTASIRCKIFWRWPPTIF